MSEIETKEFRPKILWASLIIVFPVTVVLLAKLVLGWNPLKHIVASQTQGKMITFALIVLVDTLLLLRARRINKPP